MKLECLCVCVQAVSKHNTATQNRQCLTNFELSEYQQVLTDLVLQIYHQLVTYLQGTLRPLISEEE